MSDPVEVAGVGTEAPADPPKFELTEDKNQIKHGDHTYVRAEALRDAREENRRLNEEFRKLEPVLPEFQEYLQNKQGKITAARTAAPTSDDYSDEELVRVASLRGYLSSDGSQYDLTRAKQDLDLMTGIADRRSQRHMAPHVATTAADRAARNRQDALGRTYVDGQPVADRKFIEEAYNNLPAELAADSNVGNLAQVLAAGLEYLDKRKNGTLTSRREPVFSESSRSRYDTADGQISRFAQVAARARGKSEPDWAKAEAAKPGGGRGEQPDGSFVLEDS